MKKCIYEKKHHHIINRKNSISHISTAPHVEVISRGLYRQRRDNDEKGK